MDDRSSNLHFDNQVSDLGNNYLFPYSIPFINEPRFNLIQVSVGGIEY